MIWSTLASQAGTIMTVGGSVVVALIGAYAMVRARKASPGREPVPFKDIWEENRLTRHEANLAHDENLALERKVVNQGSALIVMWAYIGRLIESWGTPTMPRLSHNEQAVIDRVIEDVKTPGHGIALEPDTP